MLRLQPWPQPHRPFIDSDQTALPFGCIHGKAGTQRPHLARLGLHDQRPCWLLRICGSHHMDITRPQQQPPLGGAKDNIQRAATVQHQLRAVGQSQTAALTTCRTHIGGPTAPRHVCLHLPGRTAAKHQQHQGLHRTTSIPATPGYQCGARQRRKRRIAQTVQALLDDLDALPGLLVQGILSTPGLPLRLQRRVAQFFLQLKPPFDGLLGQVRRNFLRCCRQALHRDLRCGRGKPLLIHAATAAKQRMPACIR